MTCGCVKYRTKKILFFSAEDYLTLPSGSPSTYYVDSIGFQKVPEFLQEKQPQLTPDEHLTGEQIERRAAVFMYRI